MLCSVVDRRVPYCLMSASAGNQLTMPVLLRDESMTCDLSAETTLLRSVWMHRSHGRGEIPALGVAIQLSVNIQYNSAS